MKIKTVMGFVYKIEFYEFEKPYKWVVLSETNILKKIAKSKHFLDVPENFTIMVHRYYIAPSSGH